jgi:2'-5' RNA ligase
MLFFALDPSSDMNERIEQILQLAKKDEGDAS